MGKRHFYLFFVYTILCVNATSVRAQSTFSEHEPYIDVHPDFKSVALLKDSILNYQLVSYYYSIKANISNPSSSVYLCEHPEAIDYISFARNYPSDFFIFYEGNYKRFSHIETQQAYRGIKILHYSQSYYITFGDLGTATGSLDPSDAYEISEHRAKELIELGIDKKAKIIRLSNGSNALWFNEMTYRIEPFDSMYHRAVDIAKMFLIPNDDKQKMSAFIPDPNPPIYQLTGFHNTSYKIYPKDDSFSDPSLVSFIRQLQSAVKTKDTTKLFECLDPDIVLNFNKRTGSIAELSEAWQLEKKDSKLWRHLSLLLSLGGEWEDPQEPDYYIIPFLLPEPLYYNFSHQFNWHTSAVCIDPKVPVYQEPDLKSKIVNHLSYDIVEIDTCFKSKDFFRIKTINTDIHGFIPCEKVLRFDIPFIGLRKIEGRWFVVDFSAPYEN